MYSKFVLTYRAHREVTLPTIHFIEIMTDRPTDGHEGTKKSFPINRLFLQNSVSKYMLRNCESCLVLFMRLWSLPTGRHGDLVFFIYIYIIVSTENL